MPPLTISADLRADLCSHAEAAYPLECCGALLGHERSVEGNAQRDGQGAVRVVRIVSCENAAQDPRVRYAIAPEELLALYRSARREGLEVVGYYHSHPRGDGVPSAIDRAESWPDLAYVIIPVKEDAALAPRCWRFAAEGPLEEPILDARSGSGSPERHEAP